MSACKNYTWQLNNNVNFRQMIEKRQPTIDSVQPVRFVEKANGTLKGYAVNTYHGMVKNFNQDRVSIIMNITKPNFKGRWPKCSYFGVFDGHGGEMCSNFLKDNLHKFITENSYFPTQPIQALKSGFKKAESQFIRIADSRNPIQKSGSCAIVVLVIDHFCYIANVGDSRAILSSNRGQKVYALSNDHKPDTPLERQRIQKANGKIYQSFGKSKNGVIIPGPFRISPGKLSVSRAFGDIQAKLQKYGGNPKVLIAKPQITYFEINHEEHDFIVMGSDGIYDKLNNSQIVDCFWEKYENKKKGSNSFIGDACSEVMNLAMKNYSLDNITSLIIAFEDSGRFDLPKKSRIISSKKQEGINEESQKENTTKSMVNNSKGERGSSKGHSTSRKSKKEPKRMAIDNQIEGPNASKPLNKESSFKSIKKELSNKSLVNSFKSLSKQEKEPKQNLLEKLIKKRNLQKIR